MRLTSRFILLLVFLLQTSCLVQTENSNSSDDDIYGSGEGSAAFLAARAVMLQNCKNCHQFHTMTEQELVDAGKIIRGNSLSSPIYNYLQGSDGSGPKSMPPGGPLSVGQIATIKDWIDFAVP